MSSTHRSFEHRAHSESHSESHRGPHRGPSTPPPDYVPTQSQLQQHNFVLRYSVGCLKAFLSESSMRMYEEAKQYTRMNKTHPSFQRLKTQQNMYMGIPLLMSERCISVGFGERTYLRLFEGVSSPKSDRLYGQSDNQQIGQVMIRVFNGYHRYRIQLRGVEIVLIVHRRLPIADFRIGDDRFRFVRNLTGWDVVGSTTPFSYGAYLLGPEQPSLVDGMGASLTVDKRNPVLGNEVLNFFVENWRFGHRSKYISPYQCGSFDATWAGGMIVKRKRCATLSIASNVPGNPDSNLSVDLRSLIFVAVSLVLHSHELDIQSERSPSRVSISNGNSSLTDAFLVSPFSLTSSRRRR
ncbi:hypothetical protein JCM33374_g4102 [Metschnikowia sp. JCM 33374]|nr:hypothetical protein JCM33374_g4102 [Metschnikowia sp. JCM 33374]